MFKNERSRLTTNQTNLFFCTQSQNEVRNARTNNNQSNNHSATSLTVNNATTSQPAACSIQSTTNVLRTLTNTFVPNMHHPQTNHTFG